MRTTLLIDDNLLLAAKTLSQVNKKTLGQVISELALQGLSMMRRVDHKKGFPIFSVGPDAQPITLEHVKKDEDDE